MLRAMASPDLRDPYDAGAIGAAVKQSRTRLGLSVEALAEESGVSMGQISQIERGKANPSLRTLNKIAAALGVPLVLLVSRSRKEGVSVMRAGEGVDLPLADQPEGYRRELLTPSWVTGLQVIRTELPPGYSNEGNAYRHLGFESVTVLSGRLRVVVGSTAFEVGAGDTINYDCAEPHWWANANDGTTVVLGSVIPVSP